MIAVMIPFLQSNVIARTDVREYLFESIGYGVIDNFAPIFDDKDQVIIQENTE
jgi:hypothetical protein